MTRESMTYNEWCDLHSFNPENDDNFSLYLIWVQRQERNQ